MSKFLDRLFLPDELVFSCGPIVPGKGPAHTGTDTLAAPFRPDDVYYAVNPLLDPAVGRKSENVAAFRNFLLEIDNQSLEFQRALIAKIEALGMPVALATFSGGKSIHMIVSLIDGLPTTGSQAERIQVYKRHWQALAAHIETKLAGGEALFDRACQDPARLSRLPGAHESGRLPQTVEHVGGLISHNQLVETLGPGLKILEQKQMVTSTVAADPSMSVPKFESELKARRSLAYLREKLELPEVWAAPAGMYGELFKLALWAIDTTGVPQNTLLAYLHKKVFPIIKASGYPRDLERPVVNAYQYKQTN